MKTLNIVIPMAGHGSRFKDVGYELPKPLIDVAGKPMIDRVVKNISPKVPHRFIFICLREHYESHDLEAVLHEAVSGSDYEVILLDNVTDGAARTVLHAKAFIDTDDDILLANSDQYISLSIDDFITAAHNEAADGLIMTFEDTHPKWSFAKTDESGRVTETAEKVPISSNATVGVYYFRRGSDFVRAAERMVEKDARHNGEFYVCPVYNELIVEDARILIHHIEKTDMHGLGTPEDLEEFLQKVSLGTVSL